MIRLADKIMGKLIQNTTLQSLKEAAGNRHVWWLEFDWKDRRKEFKQFPTAIHRIMVVFPSRIFDTSRVFQTSS